MWEAHGEKLHKQAQNIKNQKASQANTDEKLSLGIPPISLQLMIGTNISREL